MLFLLSLYCMGRDAEQHVVPVGPSSAGWGDKNANPFGGGGALSNFFLGDLDFVFFSQIFVQV